MSSFELLESIIKRHKDKQGEELIRAVTYDIVVEMRLEHQKEIGAIRLLILQGIVDEPEFPSDMPDELWEKLDGNRNNVVRVMRNTVRLTKNGITERFTQALKNKVA